MAQDRNRYRHGITDAVTGANVEGVSTLEPPPTVVELVKDNNDADREWKNWLNQLFEYIGVLTGQVVGTQAIKFGDSASIDAFARARTSEPETIFDSKQIHDKQPLFWDELTTGSGAAGTWSQDTASTIMDVDASTAGTITRQTFRRFNYQPGKSQMVLMTFVLQETGAAGTGLIRQVGMFDNKNGIFLEENEGTIQLVRRTYVSGSAVDEDVAQADWNIDAFDGTGPSGVTLDLTKSQIMIIDMEWLGVGRVRVGFVIDGIPYYAHQFVHANSLSGVYMSTPNLPLRYYISNDGNYASAANLEHICCSVISEGGTEEVGQTRAANGGAMSSLTAGTLYAVLGIRLKSGNIDATVDLKRISMLCSSANDNCRWALYWNPTITGTFTYNNQTDSVVQIASGSGTNPTVTGGYQVDAGLFSTQNPATAIVESALKLGADISGTVDELVLCCNPITNNITVYGAITWLEQS